MTHLEIKILKKKKLKCLTGSCPEIYLEKSFRKLKNFNQVRLRNCKILGETSLALDVNHTINSIQHKKNLLNMKTVIKKIFKI